MSVIDLELIANFKDALKNFEEFSKQATRSLGEIESASKNLGESAEKSSSLLSGGLKAVAAGAATLIGYFTGREIVSFFKEAIGAASEQEDAVLKLNAALALSGDYTEEASKHFQDFASSLQKSVGFSDDQALSLIALSKSFGATNEQAERIVKTAINFAAVTGKDVKTTVEGITKNISGFGSSLEKTSQELKGLTDEEQRNGKGLDILEAKYKDAALILSKSFSGAVIIAKAAFGELLETIGQFVIENPFVVGAINQFTAAINALTDFINDNREAVNRFITNGIKNLLDTIPAIINGLEYVVIGFKSISVSTDLVRVALAAFAVLAIDVASSVTSAFAKVGATAFSPIIQTANLAAKGLLAVGAISSESADKIAEIAKANREVSKEGVDVFADLRKQVAGYGKDAVLNLSAGVDSISDTTAAFNTVNKSVNKYISSIKETALETGKADGFFKSLSDSVDKNTRNFALNAKELDKLKESLKGLTEELIKADAERDPVEAAIADEAKKLQIIQDSIRAQILSEVDAQDYISSIKIDAAEKIAKAREKIETEELDREVKAYEEFVDEIKKRSAEALKSPLLTDQQAKDLTGGPQAGTFTTDNAEQIGQITGLVNASLKGAQGATELVSSFASTLVDSIIPGLGAGVGAIIGVLAQGPDKVKELVNSFFETVPKIIPVIVQSFVAGFIEAVPLISKAIVESFSPLGIAKSLVGAIDSELLSGKAEARAKAQGEAFKIKVDAAGDKFKSGILDITNESKAFGLNISKAGKEFGKQLSSFAKEFGIQISNAIKSLFNNFSLANLSKAFEDVILEPAREFARLVQDTFQLILTLPDEIGKLLTETIPNIFTKIFEQITQAFTTANITGALTSASDSIRQAGQAFANLIGDAGGALSSGAQSAGGALSDSGKSAGASISDFTKFAGASLSDATRQAGSNFVDAANHAGGSFGDAAQGFGAKISDVAKEAGASLSDGFKSVVDDLGGFAGKISDVTKDLIDGILQVPQKLFDQIQELFSQLKIDVPDASSVTGGLSDGGLSSGFKKIFGRAEGGSIPPGFPNDSFPLLASSGEYVIDRSLTQDLKSFLSSQGSAQAPTRVTLQVGEKQLADVLLNINRQGFRTS